MSDIGPNGLILPGGLGQQPPAPAPEPEPAAPITPPDDFGQDLLNAFAQRGAATASAADGSGPVFQAPVNGAVQPGQIPALPPHLQQPAPQPAAPAQPAALADPSAPPGGWPSVDDVAQRNGNVLPPLAPGQTTPGQPAGAPAPAPAAPFDPNAPTAVAQSQLTAPPVAPTPPAAVGGQAGAPVPADPAVVAGQAGAPPADPSGAPAPQPVGGAYRLPYLDQAGQAAVLDLTPQQVDQAVRLAAWVDSIPVEQRNQIAQVEAGAAVAIPRAEFDQYVAWKNTSAKTARDADIQNLLQQEEITPQVAALVAQQRDQLEQVQAAQQQQPQQPQFDPQALAQQQANQQQFQSSMSTYASTHGLAPQELQALVDDAVNAGMVEYVANANATYNPLNGQMLNPPHIPAVVEQSLNWALQRNPGLHSKVIAHHQAPRAPQPPVQQGVAGAPGPHQQFPGQPQSQQLPAAAQQYAPQQLYTQPPAGLPAPQAAPTATDLRKARSASLAAAPSGAVAPAPANVAAMNPQQITALIAADLASTMATP